MGGCANLVTKLATDCSAARLDAKFARPNKELLLSETERVATLELSITSVTTTGLLLPTDEPPLFLIT